MILANPMPYMRDLIAFPVQVEQKSVCEISYTAIHIPNQNRAPLHYDCNILNKNQIVANYLPCAAPNPVVHGIGWCGLCMNGIFLICKQ